MGLTPTPAVWSPAKRFLFRFLFAYLLLYNLPFPLQFIPVIEKLGRPDETFSLVEEILKPYDELWHRLVPWVGSHVFHVTITVLPNGSGDTTYNYVQVFCFLVLAVTATVLWTVLAKLWSFVGRKAHRLRATFRLADHLCALHSGFLDDDLWSREDRQVAVPKPVLRPALAAIR